jgi:hypothetical protein
VRRRQIFAMKSRQTAPIPSGAAVAVPAAVDSSPSPVSREAEEATQAIWTAPEIVTAEYVGPQRDFSKPKRKKLSLKKAPDA